MITRVGPVCLECVSLSGWSLFAVLAHSIRFDCLGRDRWSFCGVKVATHVVSDWILNSGYLCSEILASNFHPVSICATDKYTNTTIQQPTITLTTSIQSHIALYSVSSTILFYSYLDYYCFCFSFSLSSSLLFFLLFFFIFYFGLIVF